MNVLLDASVENQNIIYFCYSFGKIEGPCILQSFYVLPNIN